MGLLRVPPFSANEQGDDPYLNKKTNGKHSTHENYSINLFPRPLRNRGLSYVLGVELGCSTLT